MQRNRKAERRRLVATMRQQHRGIDDIAAEVARRERCSVLTAYRLVYDLSQEGAAERYNQALNVHIGDPGFMTRQRIGKLEAWPHSDLTPSLSELLQLADLYDTEPQRLLQPDDLSRLPASTQAALQKHAPGATAGRKLDSPTTHGVDEVDDMHRRELVSLFAAAGIGASLPLDSIEALRGALTRAAGLPDSLSDWQTVAAQYAVTVPTTPPAQVLADVLIDLAELSRLLTAGHPARLGLLAVSAQLSAYAAMCLYDSGFPRTAFRWWDAACKTADAAADGSLQAWVRARKGADLLYGPKLAKASLQLANDGINVSPTRPSIGLAEAQNLRAVSLARQGDPASRAALDDLARTVERLPAEVATETTSWATFGERRLRFAEATALMWLRDTVAARDAAARAVALHPPGLDLSVAQLQISVNATCMVLDGDVVDGLEHATQTLNQLPAAALSVKNMGDVVLAALPAKARDIPAAKELRDLIYA